MRDEILYLTELCRGYLNSDEVTLKENIDYSLLYSVSKSHNLSPTLFCVINTSKNKELVPEEVFKKFENDFYEAYMRHDLQQKIIDELKEVLGGGGIRHVFFKGAEIKEYYPVPQARVMGDIDVLIDADKRDRAKKLLTDNGFELINSNGPVYDYSKDGIKIEVHTRIISGKVGNAYAEEGFIDAVDNAVYIGSTGYLDKSYHFAYLIAHIAHHFWFYGAGIKLILDLAVMQRDFNIDYDAVFKKLDEIGLGDFGRVILSVCYKWFGTGQSYTNDTEKTERFLLSHGAFGKANRNNAAVVTRKELENGKNSSSLLTKIKLLFPSYEKLKYIPYIKFIEGRPYLTPAAWVYRIYYNFKYRRDFIKSATEKIGSDETKSDAEKELAYFKEIGLL
mgnify:CR=1 FL=1